MSDSMHFPEDGWRERGIKHGLNKVVFGSAAITSSQGMGTAVTRTAAGTYTLTLGDQYTYFKGLRVTFDANSATPTRLRAEVYSVDMAAKTVKFKLLADILTGSTTWDAGNLVDGAGESKDVTVTGAALGDFASASLGVDLQGMLISAAVKSANTVTVRLQNETGGALDLASTTLRVMVTPQASPVATDPASGAVAYIEVLGKDTGVDGF